MTPDTALSLLQSRPDVNVWLKKDGTHRKYVYLVQFTNEPRREMALRRSEGGELVVYLNKQSSSGESLNADQLGLRFPGVKLRGEYPKGTVGRTGDKGIGSAVGGCPSLLPLHNDVLRVSCGDLDGFLKLVSWYSNDADSAAPATQASAAAAIASGTSNSLEAQAGGAKELGDTDANKNLNAKQVLATKADLSDEEVRTGILVDPAKRAAVERRAVDLAKAHYEQLGFDVVEKGKPYDLLCTPRKTSSLGSQVVHVEVKGSISAAVTVHLTKNEIADARQAGKHWRSDLFVVNRVKLAQDDDGAWCGVDGEMLVHEDWFPHDEDLTATDFAYRVPRLGS